MDRNKEIELLMKWFSGYKFAYGTYTKEEVRGNSLKREIKGTARTLRNPLTHVHWAKHLDGREPLGVIPINEHNECYWGCVDVDVYDGISHHDLATKARKS